MRKDKKQVIGEEIADEPIKLFLAVEPADATSPSLHKLVKAYRGLRVDPMVARHERFKKQGARSAGLFAKRRPGAKPGY